MSNSTQTPSSPTRTQQLRGTIIAGVIAVVAIVIIVAALTLTQPHRTSSSENAKDSVASTQSSTKPKGASEDGGFVVSATTHKNAPQLEFYFDPLCPFCRKLDSALSDTLKQLSSAGQVDIMLHPLNFLDRYSPDKYSTRAASTMIYVLQHDPQHALNYLGLLFEYQPKENSQEPFPNEQFHSLAKQAGVPAEIVKHLTDKTYDSWLTTITTATAKRKDLIPPHARGFGTPLIRINGHIWLPHTTTKSEAVSAFLHAIGLEKSQVGKPDQLPSIGRNSAPNA